eukprot:362928-Chlamydomonas_euryale.AAC.8
MRKLFKGLNKLPTNAVASFSEVHKIISRVGVTLSSVVGNWWRATVFTQDRIVNTASVVPLPFLSPFLASLSSGFSHVWLSSARPQRSFFSALPEMAG